MVSLVDHMNRFFNIIIVILIISNILLYDYISSENIFQIRILFLYATADCNLTQTT